MLSVLLAYSLSLLRLRTGCSWCNRTHTAACLHRLAERQLQNQPSSASFANSAFITPSLPTCLLVLTPDQHGNNNNVQLTSGIRIRQISQLVPCSRISGAIVTVVFPSGSGPVVAFPSTEGGRRQVLATQSGSGTMDREHYSTTTKSPRYTSTQQFPLCWIPRTIFDKGRI